MASSVEVASDCAVLTWTAADTQRQDLPELAKRGYVTKYGTKPQVEIEVCSGHKIGRRRDSARRLGEIILLAFTAQYRSLCAP